MPAMTPLSHSLHILSSCLSLSNTAINAAPMRDPSCTPRLLPLPVFIIPLPGRGKKERRTRKKKMAAEAVGFMSRGADGGRAPELVTRDFLGGCAAADDARDAAARQQDAVPGKLSLQRHACPPTPTDLNLFPVAAAAATPCPAASPAPAASPSAGAATTTTYHSVCTIEKVKTALERFERGKHHHHHSGQQQNSGAGASPTSSSVTTSSVKRRGGVEQGDGCDSPSGGGGGGGGGMVAAACPRCFLYVLISRSDPRCPRCESHVPAPPPPTTAVSKKPRIDLNVGYLGT